MLRLVSKRNASSLISTPRSQNPNHFRYSPSIQNRDLKTPHFNVVDYLINSCGLSPDSAARISKPISHLRSSENPDAVRRLLKHQGFAEAEINKLITWQPTLLCYPQNSLDTNLRALRDIGLSTSALTQIILSGPAALHLRSAAAAHRIKYWKDFFHGDEAALVRWFTRNRGLVSRDLTTTIALKLALLKAHGLSPRNVRKVMLNVDDFFTSSICSTVENIKRTKEMGFQPDSKMFVDGLRAVSYVSKDMLQKRMELFRSFGWSEDEFVSALGATPSMACLSETNLRTKMNFLMGEVRCEPSYIASHPALLMYSLEKRLGPRHRVLRLLDSKGLSCGRPGFYDAIAVSNAKFVETYVLPHKEEISGLYETYLASFA